MKKNIRPSLWLLSAALLTASLAAEKMKIYQEGAVKYDHLCRALKNGGKASMKNTMFLCSGRVEAIHDNPAEFPVSLGRMRGMVQRLNRNYLIEMELTDAGRKMRGFLLSSRGELADILEKGEEVEFIGQLAAPVFRSGGESAAVFLNYESTITVK